MPVIIELEEKLLRERWGEAGLQSSRNRPSRERIKLGLRASLQTESLVTGVLYIDVEIASERAAAGLPSTGEALSRTAHRADPDPAIDEQPRQPRHQGHRDEPERAAHQTRHHRRAACTWRKSTTSITNLLRSVDRLVSSPEITNSLVALRPTLDQYRLLGEKLNGRVDPLADSVTNSLAEADRALVQIPRCRGKPADHARA